MIRLIQWETNIDGTPVLLQDNTGPVKAFDDSLGSLPDPECCCPICYNCEKYGDTLIVRILSTDCTGLSAPTEVELTKISDFVWVGTQACDNTGCPGDADEIPWTFTCEVPEGAGEGVQAGTLTWGEPTALVDTVDQCVNLFTFPPSVPNEINLGSRCCCPDVDSVTEVEVLEAA
jgi:hypothetical protein